MLGLPGEGYSETPLLLGVFGEPELVEEMVSSLTALPKVRAVSVSCGVLEKARANTGDGVNQSGEGVELLLYICGPTVTEDSLHWTAMFSQKVGTPILPICFQTDIVSVGPLLPTAPDACLACAVRRRGRVRPEATAASSTFSGERLRPIKLSHEGPVRSPVRLSAGLLRSIVELQAASITDYGSIDSASTLDFEYRRSLIVRRSIFLDEDCRFCRARLPTGSLPLGAGPSTEANARQAGRQVFTVDLADRKTGLIDSMDRVNEAPLPTVAVGLFTSSSGGSERVIASGRGLSWDTARQTAEFEAVERYTALWPDPGSVVYGARAELGGDAVDPSSLVLHENEQYERADFPYVRFDNSSKMWWVVARDIISGNNRLLPLQSTYYGSPVVRRGVRFAQETSNGCATGQTMAGSIISGLLEVIERHAFLMAWYSQQIRGRIVVAALRDPRLTWLEERLASEGYRLLLFDVTSRCEVPTVWALIVQRNRKDYDRPFSVTGLGCRVSIVEAAWHAASEAAGGLPDAKNVYQRERRRATRMAKLQEPVTSMSDHILMYTSRDAESHLDFAIWCSDRLDDSTGLRRSGEPEDKILEAIVSNLGMEELGRPLEVLVTDMSWALARRLKIRASRVTVPGLLPITFGAGMERLDGAFALNRRLQELNRTRNRLIHPMG